VWGDAVPSSIHSKLIAAFTVTLVVTVFAVLAPIFYMAGAGILAEEFALWYTLAVLVIVVGSSTLYAIYINRVAFSPLKLIDRFLTETASAGDLSARLNISGGREVLSLASSINNILSKLEEKTKELIIKERLAAIGQMALMVGHDLRNPLQTIRYSIYLLEEDLKRGLPAEGHLSRINRCVKYMDKTVSDLQDLSRSMRIEPSKVKLVNVIKEALSMVEVPENVEVVVDADPSAEAYLDAALIERALVNLILNAVQAVSRCGKILISSKVEGGAVSFSVEDTGSGLSRDELSKIFTPFYTTKPKGLGLGLSVVKNVIENYGGKIEVDSEPGKGTKFTMTVPQRV
jgi:signal transduction histidine kinase